MMEKTGFCGLETAYLFTATATVGRINIGVFAYSTTVGLRFWTVWHSGIHSRCWSRCVCCGRCDTGARASTAIPGRSIAGTGVAWNCAWGLNHLTGLKDAAIALYRCGGDCDGDGACERLPLIWFGLKPDNRGPYEVAGVIVVSRKLLQSARWSLCTVGGYRVPVTARAQLSALQVVVDLVAVVRFKVWASARIKKADFIMILKLYRALEIICNRKAMRRVLLWGYLTISQQACFVLLAVGFPPIYRLSWLSRPLPFRMPWNCFPIWAAVRMLYGKGLRPKAGRLIDFSSMAIQVVNGVSKGPTAGLC